MKMQKSAIFLKPQRERERDYDSSSFYFLNLYSRMKDEMRDTVTEYKRRTNEREILNENFMFLSQEKIESVSNK